MTSSIACDGLHPAPACQDEQCYVAAINEVHRRVQAELRRSQERELALTEENAKLTARLERQAAWLSWPQYGEIAAAAALRRALLEACGIGLAWTGGDTSDGRRLRVLCDLATRANEDLAVEEAARGGTSR
jgi:hypothetical protein